MIIQRRFRQSVAAAALALGLGVFLLVGPLAPAASAATPATALDSTFASLLNTLRSTLGLGSLAVDPQLSSVAQSWSVKMAGSGTLAHNGNLTGQVSGWQKLGENVGTGGAATQIFNALVASPPHMRNMSDREYTRIGVGTVTDGQGRLWTTHVFMRPKAEAAAPAPAPAPAPRASAAPKAAPAPTAPKAAPPAAAPVTSPPATAAPTTFPVPTTAAPAPVETAIVGEATPAEPPATPADPLLASSSSAPRQGSPAPLVAGAALLGLLALSGGGLVLRRSSSGGSGTRPA